MQDLRPQNHNKIYILWLKVKILLIGFLSICGLFISDSLDSLVIKNSRNDENNDQQHK